MKKRLHSIYWRIQCFFYVMLFCVAVFILSGEHSYLWYKILIYSASFIKLTHSMGLTEQWTTWDRCLKSTQKPRQHKAVKALANEDTLLRTHCCRHKCFHICQRAQHLLRTQIFVRDTKNVLVLFRNILCLQQCFPVCAAQETPWATMCPPQCVPVCLGL